MKIYLGADHRGYKLKEEIKSFLEKEGYIFDDLGNSEYDPKDDYPIFAKKVAEAVLENPNENRGILICGSGIGMNIVANRFKGIRGGMAISPWLAEAGRRDDDINVLILSADIIDLETALSIINKFLTTDFSNEERYKRRINQIDEI